MFPVLLSCLNNELFREGERNRYRSVARLDLAEGPALHRILHCIVEFTVTSGRGCNGDGDDIATRSNGEAERHLTGKSRLLLQVLIVDVTQTRRTLTDNLHDVCSRTRATTCTHVNVTGRRSLDRSLGAGSNATATTAEKASETVTDTTGTTFCVAFVEATVSLTATTTENGLTRRLETCHVLQHLVNVLRELLVLHKVISSVVGLRSLSGEELQHATGLRSIRLTLSARLTTTTGLLTRLLRFFFLLFFGCF